jgi:hypothetical protein
MPVPPLCRQSRRPSFRNPPLHVISREVLIILQQLLSVRLFKLQLPQALLHCRLFIL